MNNNDNRNSTVGVGNSITVTSHAVAPRGGFDLLAPNRHSRRRAAALRRKKRKR